MNPRRWSLAIGSLLVSIVVIVALFPDRLASVSPYYMAARPDILMGSPPFPPGGDHLVGTDVWGRDMWSRIVYGTRWSLLFALLIMGARLTIAIPVAGLATFGPRPVRWLVERLYVATSAIPPLLVYLLILGLPALREIGLLKSAILTVSLLTLIETPRIATVLKGRLEALAREEFIEGAVAVGAPPRRIFWTHMMPHLWPTLLHTIAAEMGRALLVIAQLGIFQIFIGGGMTELIDVDGGGTTRPVIISGIPEWGSELADARRHLVWKPWIAMAPATAFLIGVIGFNLLAQGLEGVKFSLARWKEATTGRISARWRWALLVIPVALVYIYSGGLPWGREAGIRQLAERQTAALSAGSVSDYLATLAPDAQIYRKEQERWAASAVARNAQVVVARPMKLEISGSRARATWRISFGYQHESPTIYEKEIWLVRRHGRWYEEGEGLHLQRGLHVDVAAAYDPADTGYGATVVRRNYRLVATAADHAHAELQRLFPAGGGAERPLIKLYPTHKAYALALGLDEETAPTSYYAPGESIRLSPKILEGLKRWQVQQEISFELLKQMIATRGGSPEVLPLALGFTELGAGGTDRYDVTLAQVAGGTLRSLTDLLATDVRGLPREEMRLYQAQTAVLAEFLKLQRPGFDPLSAVREGSGGLLPQLAAALGMEPGEMVKAYDQYMEERILERSVLQSDVARQRIPDALLASIAGRAAAAVAAVGAVSAESAAGEEYLGWHGYQAAQAQAEWLVRARAAGLARYEVQFLDMDPRLVGGEALVHVLEKLTLLDGRTLSGVVLQQWRPDGDRWVATRVTAPAMPEGRK